MCFLKTLKREFSKCCEVDRFHMNTSLLTYVKYMRYVNKYVWWDINLGYLFLSSAKPRIQPAPSLLKALIGQTVTLPCVVQGEPSPEVSWFHNGLPVGVKNTTPLRIQQVSLADQGTYQCVARNSAGQETLEIKLEILGEYLQFSSSDSVCWPWDSAVCTVYCESCLHCKIYLNNHFLALAIWTFI